MNKKHIIFITAIIIIFFGAFTIKHYTDIANTEIVEEIIEETIPFEHITRKDSSLRKDTEKKSQEGHDGKKSVTYEVVKSYGKETSRKVKSSTILIEPVEEIKVIGTKIYYKCSNGAEYETESEKDECESRISWEKTKSTSLNECYNDPDKFNCWYDNYPGTTLHWTEYTYSEPTYSSPSYRTGAVCRDGTSSRATGRGACSHHGGVLYWI